MRNNTGRENVYKIYIYVCVYIAQLIADLCHYEEYLQSNY